MRQRMKGIDNKAQTRRRIIKKINGVLDEMEQEKMMDYTMSLVVKGRQWYSIKFTSDLPSKMI